MEKYIILILIIIFSGTFGGVVRYLNTADTSESTNWKELSASCSAIQPFIHLTPSPLRRREAGKGQTEFRACDGWRVEVIILSSVFGYLFGQCKK